LAALVPFPLLPNFSVFSDSPEVVSALLTLEAIHAINTYELYFKFIHYSDQSHITPKYKKVLRFGYKLPDSVNDIEKLHTLTKMIFFYIDLVSHMPLSKTTIARNEKLRLKTTEQVSKQEIQERQQELALKKTRSKEKR